MYIKLCTNYYLRLWEARRDAEQVETAHHRAGMRTAPMMDGHRTSVHNNTKPAPMNPENIQLRNQNSEE